jgi:hypothetical protein
LLSSVVDPLSLYNIKSLIMDTNVFFKPDYS